MFKNREQRREHADRIIALRGKKSSASNFSLKFIAPAVLIAFPVIIHMRSSNIATLNGSLELYAFIASLVIVAIVMFRKVKAINIDEDRHLIGDYLIRLPKFVERFLLLFVFSFFVSISVVWTIAITNRALDGSSSEELMGKLSTKSMRDTILVGSTYIIDIQPDAQDMKRIRFKVPSTVYKQMRVGDKVIIFIKNGAFGYSYATDVKLKQSGDR